MALKLVLSTVLLAFVLVNCQHRHVGSQRVPEYEELSSRDMAKRSYRQPHHLNHQRQDTIDLEIPRQSSDDRSSSGGSSSEERIPHEDLGMVRGQKKHRMQMMTSQESNRHHNRYSEQSEVIRVQKVYHNTNPEEARNGHRKPTGFRSRSHQGASQQSRESQEDVVNKIY